MFDSAFLVSLSLFFAPYSLTLFDYFLFPSASLWQDILEYKKKQRPQKIRMLDGAIKTIMVDDSKTVGELLVTICSRIGAELTMTTLFVLLSQVLLGSDHTHSVQLLKQFVLGMTNSQRLTSRLVTAEQ